jgi:hypothetical protein
MLDMADNGHSNGDLPLTEVSVVNERRAFLKRVALAGLPIALATVRPRTAWAGTKPIDPTKPGNPLTDPDSSCSGSLGSSGCAARKSMVVPHLL